VLSPLLIQSIIFSSSQAKKGKTTAAEESFVELFTEKIAENSAAKL